MNIKGLSSNLIPIDPRQRVDSTRAVKSQESAERDANGRREDQGGEEAPFSLSEEDFNKALELLKDHPGVKTHALVVRVEVASNGKRAVYIEQAGGHVVRRLSESDLWRVTRESNRTKGQLLDKAS